MNDIVTNEFVYEIYDDKNRDHLDLINVLKNDELTSKYFKDFDNIVSNSDNEVYYTYIVLNNLGVLGLITLTKQEDSSFVFSHIINPQFRGNKYSSKIKLDFINYMNNSGKAREFICYIDVNNKQSISSMLKTNPTSISMTDDKSMLVVKYTSELLNKNIHNK